MGHKLSRVSALIHLLIGIKSLLEYFKFFLVPLPGLPGLLFCFEPPWELAWEPPWEPVLLALLLDVFEDCAFVEAAEAVDDLAQRV